MIHLRRTYELPASLEDDFSAALWLAGTLGVRSTEVGDRARLEAWFNAGAEEVEDAARWRERGVVFLGEEIAPTTDWLAAYRESATPFAVGERFWVDPREPREGEVGGAEGPASLAAAEASEAAAPARRFALRLPARTAFGTGSHESTALAIELLEELAPLPRLFAVLDVGTGTGILAFAALLLAGAAPPGLASPGTAASCSTVAFDLDPAAVFAARDNARLNAGLLDGARPLLFVGTVEALGPEARFDLLLVNVIPEEIAPALPSLLSRLKPGGELIFSGILAERGKDLVAELSRLGLIVTAERQSGEWTSYRFRLASG